MKSDTETTVASPFIGDSEMARRCRAVDWAATSLGPIEDWSPALRTAVRMALESPFPVNLWCGPDLQLIYNDAYIRALGAKHPRALGQSGREAWAEIWPTIGSWFEAIRRGEPAVFAEDAHFVMERSHGPPGEAWFTFGLSPIRDDNGSIVAFFNPAAETTNRIMLERALHDARVAAERAEQYLREIFAQAPAFMAVLRGKDHVFDFANDAYLQLVGHRDVIGKPVAEALPEVIEQGLVDLLDRVLTTGVPFIGRAFPVLLQRSPDAPLEERFVDFVYQPLTDATGARVGIVAHGTDVTENVISQREIERLLRESESARAAVEDSEKRYRVLANAIPVQVWTATPDGAVEYTNERTSAYFGKPSDELVGERWMTMLHPDDVEPTLTRWKESLATGTDYQVEFRLWSAAHRSYRWHLGRALPQRDEDGAIIRWFGTNTDIEDAKRAEAELKRLTAEATEANHAKSAFLAAMSHELRTPLNAIGGYTQLIEMGVRGPITEEQRIDLLKIQRSKEHLDTLVSDVLNFAKLGSGKIDYRIRDVPVKRILSSVVDMVTPQVAEKGLELVVGDVDALLEVHADEDKLRQILLNLLANALKFTARGGRIALRVSTMKDTASIAVSDTGIGIPADEQERVFEPFVQSKRAISSSDQGVGLGLAISRQLARAMQGELTLESAVGAGSTFTITLPRGQRDERATSGAECSAS
jgi:PAS domain S-box-containing protein